MTQSIGYTRKQFASILGLKEKALSIAEQKLSTTNTSSASRRYSPKDISTFRKELGRYPKRIPTRHQLFLNFKGGTGKTSISTSYAFRLAEMGYQVLLVDLDSQGHAAKCIGSDPEACEKTLYDVLVKKTPLEEVILKTALDELHMIPSNLRMSTVDLALMPMHAREFRLQQALESLKGEYDFIIMDAPPSFGLLNLNAIMAANDLFIPVLADFLSFHGLKLLFETIAELEQDLELELSQIAVVINHYNPITRIAQQARDALKQHYRDYLYKTLIRQCTKFAQASSEGVPISIFDPTSKGAEDINSFIAEVFKRTNNFSSKETHS